MIVSLNPSTHSCIINGNSISIAFHPRPHWRKPEDFFDGRSFWRVKRNIKGLEEEKIRN